MKTIFKILFFLLAIFLPLNITAHDFEVDGIYYNIINDNEATVTYKNNNSSQYPDRYIDNVTIPSTVNYNGTTYSVTSIDDKAFYRCLYLTGIEIPNSITTIGRAAFYSCSALENVYITDIASWCKINFTMTSANPLSYANHLYLNSVEVSDLILPDTISEISNYAFYGFTGIMSIIIPNSVNSIGQQAFANCTGLTSVNIGNSVTAIGERTFVGCTALTSVTIGSSVTTIGIQAFSGCTGLTSIIIPNSVTTIGQNAFHGCTGLTSVTIGNSVTTIGFQAFSGCTGLTSIDIPNSVSYIYDYAFDGCTNLINIEFPESIIYYGTDVFLSTAWYNNQPNGVVYTGKMAYKYKGTMHEETIITIKDGTIGIANYAFRNCDGLTNILIPNTVTSIGAFAFEGCTNLRNQISFPKSVRVINDWAFYSSSFSHISFEGNIEIMSYSFANGKSAGDLELLAFYGNIKNGIGQCAFWQNTNYTNTSQRYINQLIFGGEVDSIKGLNIEPGDEIYSYNPVPPIADENTFLSYDNTTVHVPASSFAAYFTDPYWSNFANIVGDAIEPQEIIISQDSIEVNLGTQINLTASVIPTNATPNYITWESTNSTIATVNNGTVTTVGVGECDIIAHCLNKKAICHVVVNNTTATISLDQLEVMVLPNHIITLTPSASPYSPELAVTSSDPTVAAARVVNGKVQVVGIKEGTTTITVGSADGIAVPATCLVTVYTERGDVNMDGFINISDVTDMIDYLLGAEMTDFKGDNADLDGDGKISISDVTNLIDYILSGEWPWTPQPTTPSTITFDATVDVGDGSSMASEFTVEKDGITIHVEQGVANGYHYRFYKNRKVTITSTIGDITSIVFDCIGADNDPYGSGGFTSESGVYEPIGHQGIWTNSGVSQVVFTATNFQVRATKITVTVASNTELFAPSINPISGTYYEPVEVYMTCLTGDAKIYYNTDGSSPTVNSTLYTAPFTIPFELGNTVVKAISAKDGKISEVTTASYTFAERPPFGWANMYETPDNTEVTFTYPSIVLWQSGNTIYCKDETGYGVVYGNTGQTYQIGDVIPKDFGGKKTTYHAKPELSNPKGFQFATTYIEVYPDVITPDQVGDAYWAHYVLLEDVKVTPTGDNSGLLKDANGNSCTYFTTTFGVPAPEDGEDHDVWGIVAVYKPMNGDLEFQILPISFDTIICHSLPARQNWQ